VPEVSLRLVHPVTAAFHRSFNATTDAAAAGDALSLGALARECLRLRAVDFVAKPVPVEV